MRISAAFAMSFLLGVQLLSQPALCQVMDAPSTGMDQPPPTPTPRPNPDSNGKYHVGDGVTGPKFVVHVYAEYSDEGRRAGLNGFVLVGLTVDTEGNPTNVHVMRSLAESVPDSQRAAAVSMDRKAVESVQKSKFSPATFNGKPVPVDINIRIGFCTSGRGGCRP